MIINHVSVTIKPEENGQFISAIGQFEKEAQQFSGCQKFVTAQTLSEKNRFDIYEEWENADAFKAYEESDSFTRFRQLLGPLFSGSPTSNRYEVVKPVV